MQLDYGTNIHQLILGIVALLLKLTNISALVISYSLTVELITRIIMLNAATTTITTTSTTTTTTTTVEVEVVVIVVVVLLLLLLQTKI